MDTTELEDHQSALPQNFLTIGWPNQERGHYIITILDSNLSKVSCSLGTTGYSVFLLSVLSSQGSFPSLSFLLFLTSLQRLLSPGPSPSSGAPRFELLPCESRPKSKIV